jgi:hypothetical protein
MNLNDRFHCPACEAPQGDAQGEWYVYPNPCICKGCGTDNSQAFMQFMIAQATAPKKRKSAKK